MNQLLKDVALKTTPQRQEILQVLRAAKRPLTVGELYAMLIPCHINLSTIYRTLGALSKRGLLIKTVRTNGTADYQLHGDNHCHEMVCTGCGERTVLPACPLGEISRRLEAMTGYTVMGHSLEFIGVCPHCQKTQR